MEVNLVDNQSISISTPRPLSNQWTHNPGQFQVSIKPLVLNTKGAREYQEFLEKRLLGSLGDDTNAFKGNTATYGNATSLLTLSMTLTSVSTTAGRLMQMEMQLFGVDAPRHQPCILKRLREVFGENNVTITLEVKDFKKSGEVEGAEFKGKGMEIKELKNDRFGCEYKFVFPRGFSTDWLATASQVIFSGRFIVTATLSHEAVSTLFQENVSRTAMTNKGRVILADGVGADLVIVASNDAELKCHKCFLSASSSVFKAMFSSGMKESTSSILKLPDMSEVAVRALLSFIYEWDVTEALKSAQVAVELYMTGHKYEILQLESAMEQLISSKPVEWFNVDMAVKLLLFLKNFYQDDSAKKNIAMKAVQALKMYSVSDLRESEEFQEANKNQKTAMELSSMLVAFAEEYKGDF